MNSESPKFGREAYEKVDEAHSEAVISKVENEEKISQLRQSL